MGTKAPQSILPWLKDQPEGLQYLQILEEVGCCSYESKYRNGNSRLYQSHGLQHYLSLETCKKTNLIIGFKALVLINVRYDRAVDYRSYSLVRKLQHQDEDVSSKV